MNKFYKSSNDGICKLVKVSSDQDGNVVSEIIEVKSSESGGKLSLTNMSVSFDEFNENVKLIDEAEYEAFRDITIGIIDSIKALDENIRTPLVL